MNHFEPEKQEDISALVAVSCAPPVIALIRKSQDASNLERVSPRKPCGLRTRQIMVSFTIGGRQERIKYPIVNYSRAGVTLEVTGKLHPEPGEVVNLEIVPKHELEETENEPPEAEYLKEKLIGPSKGKFLVTRVDSRQDKQRAKEGGNPARIFVALKAHKASNNS